MSDARALALVNAVIPELYPDADQSLPVMDVLHALSQGRGGGAGSRRSGGRGGGYRMATGRAYLGASAGRPEGMIKIITRGGCSNASDLRNQITYVSREGSVDVRGAEMFGLDAPMSQDEIEETIAQWSETWRGSSKYGETLHMVVSYPIGTDRDAQQ